MAKRGRGREQPPQRDKDVVPRPGDAAYALTLQGTRFSGPLPPPEVLAKYDSVVPGSAERIIAMAEKNQAHRHMLEQIVIPANTQSEKRGQIIAGLAYLAVLGCGTFLVYVDKDVAGLVQMLGVTVTFAGLFVYSRRKKEEDLASKR